MIGMAGSSSRPTDGSSAAAEAPVARARKFLRFIGSKLVIPEKLQQGLPQILGLIMLIGLVAKNAIILVDFTNQRKAEGASTYEALIDANHARLRPILMTTLAMVIGMLPIALAKGAGAEWKNGLAWVIIGGLISSLFLTLVVVPVMYAIFDKLINKFTKKKQQPIEELMAEDYEPQEFHEAYEEVRFNPLHA